MKKKIFRNLFGIAAVTAILVTAASVLLLYDFFYGRVKQEMRVMGASIAVGLAGVSDRTAYLKSLEGTTGGIRLTLIGSDGTVLYDSSADASEMENHSDRQEFIDAVRLGKGETTRLSRTLDEQTHYYAQRLPDGSVIRLAGTQKSILGIYSQLFSFMALITFGILIIAVILANRMTKSIIQPVNALDLDDPGRKPVYEELYPLTKRLKAQNQKIGAQIETIRQQQTEFESVTQDMPEGLIVLDRKASVLSVNSSAADILEIGDSGKYYGKSLWLMTRNLDIQKAAGAALRGDRVQKSVQAGGRRIALHANPVFDAGSVKGATLMLFDVTDQYESEQMRREFSANVSHELKTPLTSIKGYADMLRSGMVKQEDLKDVSERICRETDRMISLVNDIIMLSGLDEESIDPVFEKVDLKKKAQEAIDRFKTKAEKFGVGITLDAADIQVTGVPVLIDELLNNLIDNAITYNRENGTVDARIFPKGGKSVLEVADTGIGIPLKLQERVFERFFRADKSRSKSTGGTGLGLSIVKHIAKLHYAKIEMESKPGEGTCVRVLFENTAP
jgi:two-component system phosphate regulon sensor histidine kinase PhoR